MTRAAWNYMHGLLTLPSLPRGVALPGRRPRRRRVHVVVSGRSDKGQLSYSVLAPGLHDVRLKVGA